MPREIWMIVPKHCSKLSEFVFILSHAAYKVHVKVQALAAFHFHKNFLRLILDVCTALHQGLSVQPCLTPFCKLSWLAFAF